MLAVNLWEFLWSVEARWVIGLSGFAVLTALIVYAVGKWRESTAQGEPPASQLLTNLRELEGQGVLADGEYRTIKTALEARLRDEQAAGSKT
jgi:hypothetical protein